MKPNNLRCDFTAAPLAIDATRPRLSWILGLVLPKDKNRRNVSQTAYQILVASREDMLDRDEGDLWESGKVESSESINIIYSGVTLSSRLKCYWKVKAWDEQDAASDWSTMASWIMGILPGEWQGTWIGARETVAFDDRFPVSADLKDCPAWIKPAARREHPHGPGPENDYAMAVHLRKEFSTNGQVTRAIARIAGLGYHELYMNGEKASDSVLDPGATQYDKTVLYRTYDVTSLLQDSGNCIGVILGNGWFWVGTPDLFGFENAPWAAPPRCLMELELVYENGTAEIIATDGTWQFTEDGPIRFNCIRSGEVYDARKDLGNWCNFGGVEPDDARWHLITIVTMPPGTLKAQLLPPIKVQDTFGPVNHNILPDGKIVYWFPKNNAGWVEIAVRRTKPGQTIMIELNEKLDADGSVDMNVHSGHTYGRYQTVEYTCKGDGSIERWHPRFCYAGFQYVQVTGIKPENIVEITAQQVCTWFKPAGEFQCSNLLINEINDACKRTFKNGFHSYPQDCPQREKAGWTEDALLSAHGSIYNYDALLPYEKWIGDLVDSQHESGQVPDIVPSPGWGKPTKNKAPDDYSSWTNDELGNMADPWWGGAIVMLPWLIYEHYGDIKILEVVYPAMKRYVDFLLRTTQHAENDYDYMIYWPTMLGDWLEVGSGGSANRTQRALTCTQAFYRCVTIVAKTASLLELHDDETNYADIATKIDAAFNAEYLDADAGLYAIDSQSAQAMSLFLGMVPSEMEQKVFDQLVKNVEETRGGHLSTGIVGTYFLYKSLGQHGRADVAFRAITAKGFPGFEHMLTRVDEKTPIRSTTLWEDWGGVSSLAHPVQGCVASFFYEYLAGIQPIETGFKKFVVSPCIVGDMTWVNVKLDTYYGTIISRWSREQDATIFKIHVPPNTTAEIHLPCTYPPSITENGIPIFFDEDKTMHNKYNDRVVINVGSGDYSFSVKQINHEN